MKKLLTFLLLFAFAGATAEERKMTLERDFGTLHGTLTTPDSGSETAVLIIAGSGPTDRNGNSQHGLATNAYLYMAQELEKAGIASLRYDKRGIGTSQYNDLMQMYDVVLDDYIGDAAALAAWLHEQGFKKVVLAGHSEGALIAICVARNTPCVSAVVSIAGAGFPLDEVLRLQLARELVPAHMDLMMEAEGIIAKLKRGEKVNIDLHSPNLRPLFNTAVQPFLISWFGYNPQQIIREVKVPVLIINGDNDIQIGVENADALAKAQPRAKKVIVPGMTHVLKYCETREMTGQSQAAVYASPAQPLDAAFVAALTTFIGGL